MKLEVLFEDNHLLAVHKPAGLLVQGDHSGDETLLDVAASYLKHKYDKPGKVYLGLVHRLDRNVSGVVLLATTSKAAGRLSGQFRDGTVDKIYQAVVTGCPPNGEGELRSWLAAKGDARGVTRAEPEPFAEARKSLLRYNVVESRGGWSLVVIKPVTGRRHQIRAQMALEGHPLLGDVKYGSQRRLADHRIALHALSLTVSHPVGGKSLILTAPLPEDWPWPVVD
ncbi:MAG: RluA family pseudouridine synthase [Candidatus Krumholzibacteria bacterium]|nr:RluA family pseudouridine synthase [Candidatus Krumholzibacteria bacterium]